MSKIIQRLCIVVAIVFVVNIGLKYIMQHYIFSKTLSGETGGTTNFYIKNNAQFDCLILGSSRAKHQLDPALLSALGNAYNLGINGAGTEYCYLLLKKILATGCKPKKILFETDIENYYQFNPDLNFEKNIHRLLPFMNEDTALQSYVSSLDWRTQVKFKIPLYSYNGIFFNTLYNYAKAGAVSPAGNGFMPIIQELAADDTTRTYRTPDYTGFSAQKINAVRQMRELCLNNNIELKLVFLPYYKNYYYKASELKALLEALNFLKEQEVINLADVASVPELADASFWKDDRHLNYKGSSIISRLVNERLLGQR